MMEEDSDEEVNEEEIAMLANKFKKFFNQSRGEMRSYSRRPSYPRKDNHEIV